MAHGFHSPLRPGDHRRFWVLLAAVMWLLALPACGAPRPGGTGPIRIDFTVDSAALNPAGKEGWFQIIQPVQNMPIHNVTITYPPGT